MYEEIEQVTIEDKYAKKHIAKNVISKFDKESVLFNILKSNYIEWANKPYTGEKQTRINWLKLNNEPEDVINDLLLTILVGDVFSDFHAVLGRFASKLRMEDPIDKVITATEILISLNNLSLYEVVLHQGLLYINRLKQLDEDTLIYIEQTKFLPPLICKPRKRTKNYGNAGYLTLDKSVILGQGNHHNKNQSLDVINLLQDIPWVLDEWVTQFDEEPNKEFKTKDAEIQFIKETQAAKNLYEEYLDRILHFEWNNDKRGRIYPTAYLITPHGTKHKKAMLDFAEQEYIDGEL